MITLFESTEEEFTTNGLGNLPDAITCVVSEERNGEYELEMEYPLTGKRYSELMLRRIIVVKPTPYETPQPFRIYEITKPLNGIVTVNAQHISYDLSGYPVSPFVANGVQQACMYLKSNSVINCPFIFSSDKQTETTMTVTKPSSIRSLLGGSEGSILDTYGGEYEFDKFSVKLHNNRGANHGVNIRYGKNLTDLKQEENCSNVYTGVYPFWFSEQDGLVQLPEKTLNASGTYNFTRIMPLDLSNEWQSPPEIEELRSRASKYMQDNKIGIPKISIDVSFVQVTQADEYKHLKLLEDVRLCDTVTVEFPELNVSATSKCIKTNYDVLTDKYLSIELGESASNIASTISSQTISIAKKPDKTFMQQAIDTATQLISGGLGGHVVIRSSTGGEHPDEILIMDTDNIKAAKKVWRWNSGGLGYSSNGYNGPYETAITQDGQIVADFIKTGSLSANRINGGTITGQTIQTAGNGRRIMMDISSAVKGYNGDTLFNLIDLASQGDEIQMTLDAKEQMSIRTPKLGVINASYGLGSAKVNIATTGNLRYVSNVEKNYDGCSEMWVNGVYCTLPVFLRVHYTSIPFTLGIWTGSGTETSNRV